MQDTASDGIDALTEREKQTLRLLLGGYDAKSIASTLNLSIHTINERLRDARRKLGVSSSREAARLLSQTEAAAPEFLVDKQIGVSDRSIVATERQSLSRGSAAGYRLAWVAGGMLIMSLIIAAAAIWSAFGSSSGQTAELRASAVAPSHDPAALSSAREWVAMVDQGQWENSWRAAATLFRSQVTAAQWASAVRPVRQPLGPLVSRKVLSAIRSSSLPGAPAGDYTVIQFQTAFARKSDAVETVTVVREGARWKVAGYFIR